MALTAAAAEVPASFGPFVLEAEGAELRVGLATQLLAQLDLSDQAPALAARIRRARCRLDGTAWDGRVGAAMQISVAPGLTDLLDLWVQVAPSRGEPSARVGFFKIPYTRYRDQSFTQLVTSDWPTATTFFGAERQLGASLGHGSPGPGVGWTLGIFTGVNGRRSYGIGIAEAHGVVLSNPSDLANGTATVAPVHPELVGRVTYGSPGIDSTTSFDVDGGPARMLLAASGTWDLDPDPDTDFAARAAAELLVKVHRVSFNGVGYLGWFRTDDGDARPAAAGGVAEIAWRPDPRLGLAGTLSVVDLLPDLQRDTHLDDADPKVDPADTSELGGGVTWFVHGTALALQADAAWQRTPHADGARCRLQTQVVF